MSDPESISRRRLLQAGTIASALSLLSFHRSARAQERNLVPAPALQGARDVAAVSSLTAPRMALVIGNSRYRSVPLKNPENDAQAISAELKTADFAVTTLVDAGVDQMRAGIEAFGRDLAKRKAVGVFYFAGHGVQLAWRNYLVPVDAQLTRAEDVPKAAVDLGELLAIMGKAGNPANVVILDACRNNPFDRDFRVEQRGLSQVDAPVGTLLAYATAPGNVASDGEGANGLYTEHLLKEMKVADAKVEDIFKRVRLGVRRQSRGNQVPWESTSLEDDFWFIPPRELKRQSEGERARRYAEELQAWEGARGSKDVSRLEGYLRRFPNGEFAELAQLELDEALRAQGEKRIEVAPQAGNPYSQGFVRADVDYKVGDFYRYRVLDLETQAEKRIIPGVVTAVTGDEVVFGNGVLVLDRMGNVKRSGDGFRYTDNQNMPLEFQVGKKWTTQFRSFPPHLPESVRVMSETEYRVVRREQVVVPAGTFDCFRIEGRGRAYPPKGPPGELSMTTWYAPDKVRRFIAQELVRRPPRGAPVPPSAERAELIAYRQT